MTIADISGGRVVISPTLYLLPPFKKLWEGTKDKAYVDNFVSYVVFRNKYDSPYVLSMPEEAIEGLLKEKILGDKNYKLTKLEQECEEEYRAVLYTWELELLQNMRLKVDSISKYYKDSLNESLDPKSVKEILSGMVSVGGVIKAINDLMKAIKSGAAVNGRIKGDAMINDYELPRKDKKQQ
jgi:hypothetical protein